MAKIDDDSIVVETRWATSAGDFVPFTPLPKRFHGKKVRITIEECDCSEIDTVPFHLDH